MSTHDVPRGVGDATKTLSSHLISGTQVFRFGILGL